MKKLNVVKTLFVSSLLSGVAFADYVTIGKDALLKTQKSLGMVKVLEVANDAVLIEIPKHKTTNLTALMHEDYIRCPGYMVHATKEEAKEYLKAANSNWWKHLKLVDYSITQKETVEHFIEQVQEASVVSTITKLSSFQNRYYKATTGVESSNWLKSYWEELSKGRNDVTVELFKHASWPQPTVIATIKGETNPEEIIVIGGHADSISGWGGGASVRAPGADDNASGIATLTEVFRVAMVSGYRPSKTVMFMGYAAEEVGLLGSKDVAAKFKKEGKKVIGALQLDMTNFKGSERDIYLMSDYTNNSQNEFLAKLIDTYIKTPWGYSKCGYACSDHASWTLNGFPASIPFESKMEEYNKNIHTDKDVISVSGSNGKHAVKFAKLASAFMVEMAK